MHSIVYAYILSASSCQIDTHIAYFGLSVKSICLLLPLPISPFHTGFMGGNIIGKLFLQRDKFFLNATERKKTGN